MTDSNGPNDIDLIDGLRRWQDEFDKDFDRRDIWPQLMGCLEKNEYREQTQMKCDEKLKIDKLIFTFIYVKRNVSPLIKLLKEPYRWLYDAILNSKDDKWISDYRQAIQDIPNNRDWNIHRVDLLWNIQHQLKTLKRGEYLILFAKLGFGKRWLAA